MDITESTPPSKIALRLSFIKPFAAVNTTEFAFAPEGAGTRVTWAMFGPSSFMHKLMGMLFSMDAMLGKQFDQGLANMKAAAEKAAAEQEAARIAAEKEAAEKAEAAAKAAATAAAAAPAAAAGADAQAPAVASRDNYDTQGVPLDLDLSDPPHLTLNDLPPVPVTAPPAPGQAVGFGLDNDRVELRLELEQKKHEGS